MIIRHEFPPGSPIVEAQVAEKLGMSRTPVRSALKRLVSSGLLDSEPNKGCSVPILSRHDLDKLFDFRFLVEPAGARKAAECYDPQKHEQKVARLIDAEATSFASKPEIFHIINEKIHTAFVEIADNEYFICPVQRVTWRSQLYLFFFGSFFDHTDDKKMIEAADAIAQQEHKKIFEAIVQKDSDAAADAMRKHIQTTYNRLTSFRGM